MYNITSNLRIVGLYGTTLTIYSYILITIYKYIYEIYYEMIQF